MAFILVYITNKDEAEARKIAKHLLDKKLIACANILQSKSLYFWKGKLADESEAILLAKTTSDLYEKIKEEVKKIHSYTTPCIAKLGIDLNKDYAEWLLGELK
jgi:periplasmic divalent cation tolerance protein